MTTQGGPLSDADRELAFGSPASVPVLPREPDPLVDALAHDGVQPSERNSSGPHPIGGGR
jgi:hypothetical protein